MEAIASLGLVSQSKGEGVKQGRVVMAGKLSEDQLLNVGGLCSYLEVYLNST